MELPRLFSRTVIGRLSPEERTVLKWQLLVVFVINAMLTAGFFGQREWRRIAEANNDPLIMHAWDGLPWFVWLMVAPLMLILIRRFPLVRGQLMRSLAGLAVGSVLLYLLVANLRFGLRILPDLWLRPSAQLPIDWVTYLNVMLVLLPLDFLTYCGFFAISLAIVYYFQFRQRVEETRQLQLHAARLQSDLARAELAALRGQLHPHFLFNSFNAVAALVRQKNNDAAVEIIAQLSTLLRLAIERTGLQEVPLEEEIDFICRYLEIERVRFGDKLQTELIIEEEARDAVVPNLLLQPLVENAIKHGISLRTRPGVVRLAAHRRADRLFVEIANDGPDLSVIRPTVSPPAKPGIGLANTRARLEKAFNSDYHLEITERGEGGVVVRIDLPWRSAVVTPVVASA